MTKKIKIAPSILAGDFSRLGYEAKKAEDSGADLLHLDIMDGHFVPNITIGPQAVEAIKRNTNLPLDVHLMISEPRKYIRDFINAGASYITIHLEIEEDVEEAIKEIRAKNVFAGISIKPGTSFDRVKSYLRDVDMFLIMTVEPGFGGQKFMRDVLEKLKESKSWIEKEKITVDLEVDGGINRDNIADVVQAGANIIVAGSALYKEKDMKKAIEDLRNATSKNA